MSEQQTYPPFMSKRDARRWANALRSGKYEQGRGYLERAGKFCCVGVLCELNGESTFNGGRRAVWTELQIQPKTHAAVIVGSFFDQSIADLNDSHHYSAEDSILRGPLTFDEIADLIELQNIHGAGL